MSLDRVRSGIPIHIVAVGVGILIGSGALCPRPTSAIPAFARKYQTSCQTCHVAFPALTPFGEAFRQNGYRFPAGADPSTSKDEPVSLGAEGYKKLWPKAVWPGEMPGMPPLAVIMSNSMGYDQAAKALTFGGMGGEFEILAAGTMGEHYSFWGSVVFAREDGSVTPEMERLNLQIRPLDSPALQIKIGSFEPGLLLVSTHRSLMDQELFPLTEVAGDNAWSPEPYQQGIEAFGVVQHRLLYNGGVVDGSGSPGDNSKDIYGRIGYKLGGLEADGVVAGTPGQGLPANPKPWSEKSLTVSAFGYKGKGVLGESADGAVNDDFHTVGGDVGVNCLDLMLHAGLLDRKDDSASLADSSSSSGASVKNKSQFAELTWVAYPWLIPAGRWESFKVGADKTERVSFTVTALLQANVKTYIATDWLKEPGSKFKNEEVLAALVFGF